MIDVLLTEDVRRQDAACAARGIPVETLMENAGFAVARAARRMMGGTYGRRVVVLCGKGNNSGDGLVAGRLLAAQGAHLTAVLTAAAEALSPLAAANLQRFPGRIVVLGVGAREPDRAGVAVGSEATVAREIERADLIVDAVFGVGLSRAPEGAAKRMIAAARAATAPVLAVDVPSGVDADTGTIYDEAVRATATVTFGGLKPGLLFMPGAALAGTVEVADIGVPEDLQPGAARALEPLDVRALAPRRDPSSHKRSVGTVLVVAGSRAMPGAAALAAAGSVHGGAGLTTLCAPEDVCRVALARTPELTTIPLPESGEGTIGSKALELIRPRLGEFHAVAIGPGLTTHPGTVEAVRALVAEAPCPVVLDADGLNAFAGAADDLAAHPAPLVATPHAGELARLLGRASEDLERDRLRGAMDAVARLRATVVFKGPGTVVAGADEVFVNTTGGASLAQGGTGDVLTGVIAAFLAHRGAGRDSSGLSMPLTVAAAVWVHGAAGDRLAARLTPHPANASALVEELGPTLHEVAE